MESLWQWAEERGAGSRVEGGLLVAAGALFAERQGEKPHPPTRHIFGDTPRKPLDE
jgi:hypothetical protein